VSNPIETNDITRSVVNMRPRMTSLTESEIDILASFLTETTADTASISVATDNKGNRTIT
jgi:hypothetical protein